MAGRRSNRGSDSSHGAPDPSWSLSFDAELAAELAAEMGHRVTTPRLFDRESLRRVDREALSLYAMPLLILMENAGRAVAEIAMDMLPPSGHASVLIVCGPGNNGGDGLVAARHLHNAGIDVHLLLTAPGEQFRGEAATNLAIVRAMKIPESSLDAGSPAVTLRAMTQKHGSPDLIIDAIAGTGLTGAVREPVASLIPAINELRKSGASVLCVDSPSGLDADTGESLGQTIIGDATISFVGYKRGFTSLSAQNFLGEVVVADIGVPRELVERLGQPLEADPAEAPDQPPPPAPSRGDRRGASRRSEP
jgi:NAD(P)H-hydrate epimerase